ncbi:ATP-binding protein [Pseudomonas fulva]|uniref:ATP-binding protein n=1 Tax=Pseudomonas fulva TaxID=47880 RepID=UPI00191DFA08|nr:ATP-binding protein [Pseudomonas fulva]MBN4168146.1 ATP-binding protein [Pseudomonas fulva]
MHSNSEITPRDEAVRIVRHYRRSVRIDSDLGRPDAVDGYVLTETARGAIASMSRQIAGTNQRAFTWTGPYGGGKSSLALVLASALTRAPAPSSSHLLDDIPQFREAFPVDSANWLVLPVVGRRGSVRIEVSKALNKALGNSDENHNVDSLIANLAETAGNPECGGLLLIVDEMGKFLEASAAGGDDVHFFQDLAEMAARCKGRLVIVGILHQAFRQYASRLGIEAREEWAKVQGRFSDVSFVANGDEVVELIGRAIECDIDHPSTATISSVIGAAISERRPAVGQIMGQLLDKCWPLHPITAALLGPTSRRQFGQNERSVFGFLTSLEPQGFQDFLSTWDGQTAYGPDRFWDYLRSNLEQAILASPDGHRWAQAVEAVERAVTRGATLAEITLAKTVALIDVFRSASGVAADEAVLNTVITNSDSSTLSDALNHLSAWRVAIFRKHIGAWTIFEGSDFDIDQAVARARATFVSADMKTLSELASLTPIIAKRHYADTGTFRWLGISLHSPHEADRLSKSYEPKEGEFGRLALVLPERGVTADETVKALSELSSKPATPLIFGVPNNHELISDLGAELIALSLVYEGSPELEGDSVARREVSARLSSVKGALEEALRSAVLNASWTSSSQRRLSSSLSVFASELADEIFKAAPIIWSELINRDAPSANSVKARRDLMHRMVHHAREEHLGIEGYPAERGLYETLLASTGLHGESQEHGWQFCPPKESNPRNLFPLWEKAQAILMAPGAGTVGMDAIYNAWSLPPYGVKTGLRPVLALAFILSHFNKIAVYRDNMFEPHVSDADVDELLQDPSRFSLRWVEETNERKRTLKGLAATMADLGQKPEKSTPLEIARSLVALAYSLTSWARRTHRLSPTSRALRDLLVTASDPHRLLFIDLPDVLEASSPTEVAANLQTPLAELLDAYPTMLRLVDGRLAEALDAQPGDDPDLRRRAEFVSLTGGDLRVRGFATRLLKRDGTQEGIEGVLSLVLTKPPRDWTDLDIETAFISIAELALDFRKAEALGSVAGRTAGRELYSLVIGANGHTQVITREFEVNSRDNDAVHGTANRVMQILKDSGLQTDLLLAALAKASQKIVEGDAQDA